MATKPEHQDLPLKTEKSSGETRSFQTTNEPGQRENLTKSEAEKKGLYWKDTEEDKTKKG
jgi:hypothetical protein